jgi:hypothetical protein
MAEIVIRQEDNPEIAKEVFDEWMSHPVTKHLFATVAVQRDELVSYMVAGGTLARDAVPDSNFCVGKIQGYTDVIQVQFEPSKDAANAEGREKYGY